MADYHGKSQIPGLVVHHLNNSRSQRILWLLPTYITEELGVPYELKKYQRDNSNLAPKELLEISPLGKAPIITDGQVIVAESGAIIDFILQKYDADARFTISRSGDATESHWLNDLYYTHYAEGSLQPILVRRYIFKTVPKKFPIFLRPLVGWILGMLDKRLNQPDLVKHGRMIEEHLGTTNAWIAGGESPTRADFMMSFCLETLLSRAPDVAGPNICAYVKRVQQRPAYQRAIEKGGSYAYILT